MAMRMTKTRALRTAPSSFWVEESSGRSRYTRLAAVRNGSEAPDKDCSDGERE